MIPAGQKLSKEKSKTKLLPKHLLKPATQNKYMKIKDKNKRTTLKGKEMNEQNISSKLQLKMLINDLPG